MIFLLRFAAVAVRIAGALARECVAITASIGLGRSSFEDAAHLVRLAAVDARPVDVLPRSPVAAVADGPVDGPALECFRVSGARIEKCGRKRLR